MTVKDLIEKLKNVPENAEITLNYIYWVDGEICYSSEDVADVLFDKYSQTVDLMTKGYKDYNQV